MDVLLVEGWVVVCRNEHVVHVYCQPSFSDFIFKDGIHHCLKGGGGVGHPEEHYCRFVQSFVGNEGSLPLIAFLNVYVVVPPANVKLGEEPLHPDAVDQLGNKGQGVTVSYRPFVETSVILYG